MRLTRLGPGQLEAFQAKWLTEARSYEIPTEYLARVEVYGLVDSSGEIVGGFTLCTEPPYRYVVQLPDTVREQWERELPRHGRVVEVNWVWSERRKSWLSLYLWLRVLFAARQGGDALLAGASEERLAGLYRKALNLLIPEYEGPVTVDAKPSPREWVFLAARPDLRTLGKLVYLKVRLRLRRRER
jgi:hypothetical protein